jgi:Arc/MetJ-type ribon-helix-helix transcriptional regulator
MVMDGSRMGRGVLMAEVEKSEKITINFGLVDLGQIDLLWRGFYANRTDFIRTAIRRHLARSSIRRPAGAHRRADTPTKACASSASGTAVRAGTTTVSLLTEK